MLFCDRLLPLFNDLVVKLLNTPAMNANDVIMMQAAFQFKDSLAALEVMPCDKTRRLELGKGAVYGGQPNLFSSLVKFPVDALGCHMPVLSVFEKFQHLKPWQGGFQTGILEVFGLAHMNTFQITETSCQKSLAIANENDYRLHCECVVHVFLNLTTFIIRGGAVLARFFLTYIVAGIFAIPGFAFAADPLVLAIHDNQFEPKQLALPAGVKVKLVIRNLDGIPAEFESSDLSREVIVRGHGEVTIYIGPLDPGNYQFFNDFNHEMQGTIVVQPAVNKEN